MHRAGHARDKRSLAPCPSALVTGQGCVGSPFDILLRGLRRWGGGFDSRRIHSEVGQSVVQRTLTPRVASSSLALRTAHRTLFRQEQRR